MEGAVVGRGVELEKHVVAGRHDVRDCVAPTETDEHRVCGRPSVVDCQVVLDGVALVPHSATERRGLIKYQLCICIAVIHAATTLYISVLKLSDSSSLPF